MRILVYGAGVQGSIYGAMLAERGHQVSFLARGSRAVQLRETGLTLRGVLGSRDVRVDCPVVVGSLEPLDRYDVCLVTVRLTKSVRSCAPRPSRRRYSTG